ncbi:hypothetical protein, partial [Neisseria gonorrhoeae]|uniref:hypothetical protein n=1 Tax=Neisseria gonorrhoeae TaxID=485 RepID=UPI00384CB1E0
LGEIRDLLRRYHHVSHELENGSSELLLKELNELQLEIEAKDGNNNDAAHHQAQIVFYDGEVGKEIARVRKQDNPQQAADDVV